MSQRRRSSAQGLADRYPLVEGGLFGAVAFVVGVVVTFVVAQLDGDLSDRIDILTGEGTGAVEIDFGISSLDAVLWTFFEAHLVDIESTVEGGGESQSETVALLSEASFPELLYTVIAVAVLVGAGFLLVQRTGARTGQAAATGGAMVAIGYLPLALVSVFVSRASESSSTFGQTLSVTVGPDLVTAVLVAGLVFPLALGALGGYLGFRQQGTGHAATGGGGRGRL